MLFATVGQGALFLWMMAAGMAVGAWYLLTALLRRFIGAGFWLTLACDLLFGAGSAVILILALVTGSYGQVRFFAILGMLAGLFLFGFALSPPLKALCLFLQGRMRRIMASLRKNRLIKIIFK